MEVPASIVDPFHRALYVRIAPAVDERMIKLASGSAGTMEDYRHQVGFIEALNAVLTMCRDIERERHGGSLDQ